MTTHREQYDTSRELYIQRFRGGIKLVRPETLTSQNTNGTIAALFDSPLKTYFLNAHSEIQNTNERNALACGFESVKKSINTTARKVTDKKTAEMLFFHDRTVLTSNSPLITEEPFSRLDGIDFESTSFKFPWYNATNNVIGVFGLSITVGEKSEFCLARYLSYLMKTGLLNHSDYPTRNTIDETYGLSVRQSKCLQYLVKGMTYKQIGRILGISSRTVGHYIEAIKNKMNCHYKAELVEKYWLHEGVKLN